MLSVKCYKKKQSQYWWLAGSNLKCCIVINMSYDPTAALQFEIHQRYNSNQHIIVFTVQFLKMFSVRRDLSFFSKGVLRIKAWGSLVKILENWYDKNKFNFTREVLLLSHLPLLLSSWACNLINKGRVRAACKALQRNVSEVSLWGH